MGSFDLSIVLISNAHQDVYQCCRRGWCEHFWKQLASCTWLKPIVSSLAFAFTKTPSSSVLYVNTHLPHKGSRPIAAPRLCTFRLICDRRIMISWSCDTRPCTQNALHPQRGDSGWRFYSGWVSTRHATAFFLASCSIDPAAIMAAAPSTAQKVRLIISL